MTCEEEKVFLDYLINDDISTKNQITNSKNKRIVFLEEIDGKRYYIKKYIPKKKHQHKIFFGLKEDQAIHYKNICAELKKLKIPYIEPYYIKTFNKSLFKRTASILVTKDGGKSLMEYIPEFKNHLDWFDYFFYIFLWLTRNKIYISDYNLGGMIVGEDKILRLIDFDSYRKKYI